jgi:hypothetical protein
MADPIPVPDAGPLSAARFDQPLRGTLLSDGWHADRCPCCGRVYYARRPRENCMDVRLGCGSDYGFVGRRRRPLYRPPTQVRAALAERLRSRNFSEVGTAEVVRTYGDTLFMVAGVQFFDDVIHRGGQPRSGAFLVAPPVVRVRSLAKVGRKEGISSSFVNICTEQLNGSIDDYLHHVDSWRVALLAAGLDEDGLAFIVEPAVHRRQTLTFRTVNVNYFGFELGEAILLTAADPASPVRTIIDCGFGLERIVWAVNEVDSYFTLIGPLDLALTGHTRAVDFVRTMTLLASAGLRAANSGPGHVLRRLGRLAASEGAAQLGLDALVRHSFQYWAAFTPARLPPAEATHTVIEEVHRSHNALLAQRLGLQVNGDRLLCRPDAFLIDLLDRARLPSARLREALRQERA